MAIQRNENDWPEVFTHPNFTLNFLSSNSHEWISRTTSSKFQQISDLKGKIKIELL